MRRKPPKYKAVGRRMEMLEEKENLSALKTELSRAAALFYTVIILAGRKWLLSCSQASSGF